MPHKTTAAATEPEAASSSAAYEPDSNSDGSGAFIADPGPVFDPAAAGADAEPAGDHPVLQLGWDEQQIEQLLTAKGVALHTLLAVDDSSEEWLYTRNELTAIAGPLTRILNAYPATRAAAATADPLVLTIGISSYITRSYRLRRELLAQLQQLASPITGLAPEPTTTTEDDPWTT